MMFIFVGPVELKIYVPHTPPKKKEIFLDDTSPISESDVENDSSISYVSNVTTKTKKFKNLCSKCDKDNLSPSSSPLHWPPSPILISSDGELKK